MPGPILTERDVRAQAHRAYTTYASNQVLSGLSRELALAAALGHCGPSYVSSLPDQVDETTFTNFVLMCYSNHSPEEHLTELFHLLDRSGRGCVGLADFSALYRELCPTATLVPCVDAWRAMLRAVGRQGTPASLDAAQLTFAEFAQAYAGP